MDDSLTRYLAESYSLKRITKRPDGTAVLPIARATNDDVSHLFCSIDLSIPIDEAEPIILELLNAPHNAAVREFVENQGGQVKETAFGTAITLPLPTHNPAPVRAFAKVMRRIIARGQSYSARHWKWVCPRTADALDCLANFLAAYESTLTQPRQPCTR